MQFILPIMLAILLLFVSISLYKKDRLCRLQKKQIENLLQKVNDIQKSMEKQEENCREIWDAANTIHLYASLSEEETKLQDLKQKQSEIRRLSEKIIFKSEDKRI